MAEHIQSLARDKHHGRRDKDILVESVKQWYPLTQDIQAVAVHKTNI